MTSTRTEISYEKRSSSASDEAATAGSGLFLAIFSSKSHKAHIEELQNPRTILGADPSSDIVIPSKHSRVLEFTVRSGEAYVRHLSPDDCVIDGQPVKGERRLDPGESLRVGDVGIVLNRDPRIAGNSFALSQKSFEKRFRQEIARSLRYNRPLALIALILNEVAPSLEADIAQKVQQRLRIVDVVGWIEPTALAVLLPETGTEAQIPAQRLMRTLEPLGEQVSAGLALCPADATDRESLLACAKQAASEAERGSVGRIFGDILTLDLLDRTIVAVDPVMKNLFELVADLAQTDLPVLVTGETGVGKEIVASAVHAWSGRRDRPFVAINCAAVPESLLESELFGHEKGAFSGAVGEKPGLFESADGGTLFLDEISEASSRTQAELLRVIETKRLRRVGSLKERAIDVRVIAASNRRMEHEISRGRFRRDLFYRLSAARVDIPQLARRPRDLPVLARTFLSEACVRMGREPMVISDEAMARLAAHTWPGNVRELKNLMDYVVAVVHHDRLEAEHLPSHIGENMQKERPAETTGRFRLVSMAAEPPSPPPPPQESHQPAPTRFKNLADEIEQLEKTRMAQALEASGGVRVRAAELIGMPLRTFVHKLGKYGFPKAQTGRSGGKDRVKG